MDAVTQASARQLAGGEGTQGGQAFDLSAPTENSQTTKGRN
jgi:hypothetical protein